VTLTTVGYGDIAPSTWLGQLIAAAIMIIGYAVIAVPTGIVSA
jgi:voltage-gated potassium channel